MRLRDSEIKHAQAKNKDYKLTDGGLYILIRTTGRKYWRLDSSLSQSCTPK